MDDSQEHNLGALVTQWYKKNGRQNLPWRKSVTPYKVWISEMMLQQTQVVTAQSYYRKFLKKYPSLSSMKMATEDDILSLWSGLGYYRRASFIYQAKEKIFLDFNGRFPTTYDELITLPGIGRSTAGAILSIAYQKPFPILDANVKRVIARLFLQKDFKEGLFWDLSAQCLDEDDPYSYQQGIMDIGATLCTPKAPLCPECPL
ncbi:MAG: A/G-specific adenine glycosylase, partial [Pseudomonadota bacterium]|nr:A/G-specific adenine glycosylase [Pseudomonadota bacterium]